MTKYTGNTQKVEKAIKKFTDREEPQAVFRRHLAELGADTSGKVQVLDFYGYGGIGKTALVRQLETVLKADFPEVKFVTLDFATVADPTNVLGLLRSLETVLRANYHFSFPFFDLVAYTYERKLGKDVTRPELAEIISSNKELNFVREIIDDIPLVNTVNKIIRIAELAEKGKNIVKTRLIDQKYKADLLKIESKPAAEIEKDLSFYFAMDLNENLKDDKNPFVFFLDTYEALVNELDSGIQVENDLFLRGNGKMVETLKNTLWVISGREILKWAEMDESWKGSLDCHLLERLSSADSKWFLSEAGIADDGLLDGLYALTKGSPFYLDLCVDTFLALQEKGKTPEISDFGKDTTALVNRFYSYMSDTERDLVMLFAHQDFWTDENAEQIIRENLGSFSPSFYETFKTLSFIVNDNGKYKIIEDVRPIIIDNTPRALHEKYVNKAKAKIQAELKVLTESQESFSPYKEKKRAEETLAATTKTLEKIEQTEGTELSLVAKNYANPDGLEIANLVRKDPKNTEIQQLFWNFIANHAPNYSKTGTYTAEEFEEIRIVAEEIAPKMNLYLAKLYTDCPIDNRHHDNLKEKADDFIVKYTGPYDRLYVKTALAALGHNTSSGGITAKPPLYGFSKILADFNSLSSEVEDLSEEIEDDLKYDDKDYQDAKKRKQYIINKKVKTTLDALREHPEFLTKEVLYLLFYATGDKLGFIAQKEILIYLIENKDFVNKTSDPALLEAYFALLREFIGGADNKQTKIAMNSSVAELIMRTLRWIRPRYEEVFGKDAFIVAEIQAFTRKVDVRGSAEIFDKTLSELSKTFPVGSRAFDEIYRILMAELHKYFEVNYADDSERDNSWVAKRYKFFEETDLKYLQVAGEWLRKCYAVYDPADFKEKISIFHDHVAGSFLSLVDAFLWHISIKTPLRKKVISLAEETLRITAPLAEKVHHEDAHAQYYELIENRVKYDFGNKFSEIVRAAKPEAYKLSSFERAMITYGYTEMAADLKFSDPFDGGNILKELDKLTKNVGIFHARTRRPAESDGEESLSLDKQRDELKAACLEYLRVSPSTSTFVKAVYPYIINLLDVFSFREPSLDADKMAKKALKKSILLKEKTEAEMRISSLKLVIENWPKFYVDFQKPESRKKTWFFEKILPHMGKK